MRVLVASRHDPASLNMRDRLLELGHWEATSRTFRDGPVWSQSEAILVEVEGPTVTDERLDPDLRAMGLPLRDVWFLSRHRAESGTPSLTAHPIGNHGEARFGGQPATLSPAAPRDMGALLRRLAHHKAEAALPHSVTYEATHHGPRMTMPSLFVEIGSDDAWYRDRAGAEVMARAIQDVLGGAGRTQGPVLVGVGGGHYAPRQTDIALEGLADFGHLVPAHALQAAGDDPAVLRRAVEATPGFAGVHIHRKGLKGPERAKVEAWCAQLGYPIWSSRSEEAAPVHP
jgi:D-aminoacyl-tRNA deacylase